MENTKDRDVELRKSSKYDSYQPPVTRIRDRQMAETLIIRGHIFLRVEQDGDPPHEDWQYVFAGTSAKATADEISSGKVAIGESPRNEAARGLAKAMINEAILEHKRRESLQQTFKEVTAVL
jgi:hypothetical protein